MNKKLFNNINFQNIIEAMDRKENISFKYIKPGKTKGIRYGSPHAIFITEIKKQPMIHILQYAGASDSALDDRFFPAWRMFYLENIKDVIILEGNSFEVHPSYNPDWYGYKNNIYQYQLIDGIMRCR